MPNDTNSAWDGTRSWIPGILASSKAALSRGEHGLLERGLPHLHRTFNRALALVGFARRLAAFGGCATGGFTLGIGFTALAHILDLSFSRRIWVIVTSPRRKGAPRRVFAPGSVNQIESATEDLVRK